LSQAFFIDQHTGNAMITGDVTGDGEGEGGGGKNISIRFLLYEVVVPSILY
jgi:hypothetical protein